jgi:hypothetical protein
VNPDVAGVGLALTEIPKINRIRNNTEGRLGLHCRTRCDDPTFCTPRGGGLNPATLHSIGQAL